MITANEILNFTFSPDALHQAAKKTFSDSTISLHELRIDKLNKVTKGVGESSFKFTGETLIPQVFKKFKSLMKTGELPLESFERRELRTLTYSLSHSEHNYSQIFSSENELDFVFTTLEANWRDSYLIGLIDCYLKNWESKHTVSFEKIGKFIFKKLSQYEGGRTVLKSLKSNIKFFDGRNGDVVLGSELALNNKQIKEATKYLVLPDSWFSYPYFSKVILAYYEKRKNDIPLFIDDLNTSLQEHNNSISSKRLVSKLIIQVNVPEFSSLQDKVKSIAFRFIGDPGNSSNWTAFDNSTESEKDSLKKARNILNEWIAKQFITVFFEKCINDSRRKRFWLKYVKEITQFRVVGSTYVRQLLMSDNRISEYVSPRFSNTNSSRDSNAALMFIMKSHLFIEFSDEGSFYAYKLSNDQAPSIDKEWFHSTNDLKLTYLLQLIDRQGYSITYMAEEGKLPHRDGKMEWEDAATYWLKNKAGINV